LCLLCSV